MDSITYLYSMKYVIGIFLSFFLCTTTGISQFVRLDSIDFIENNRVLSSPYAGGVNQPQLSPFDLNGDALMDLVSFDRTGNKLITYLNEGANGTIAFRYAPEYQVQFPPLLNWALFRDYNCDGKADIFTAVPGKNAIRVFENISGPTGIAFQLASVELMADGSSVYAPAADIPAIADIDGDGDPDILSFDSGGFFVQYFENTGGCANLTFRLNTPCWGEFQEDPFTNDIYLNTACKGGTGSESGSLHSGSTLTALDVDGDDVQELLLGDINFDNLVYLHNGGTQSLAEMDQFISNYPDNTIAVDIFLFPAAFLIDANNDNLPDLIAAPNATNISANFNASWYYENTGTATQYSFSQQQTDFLQSEMTDVGSDAHPVYADVDADGLLDLLIGNLRYKDTQGNEKTALTLYKNTGTSQQAEFTLVSRDYLGISSLFNPPILGASPTLGDLDDDGDLDLLIGDLEGHLHYFRNEAGSGNPAAFTLTNPVYAGIDVGQNAAPQLIDLNRDGLLDLLVGEKSGNLNYFPNTGTATTADFSSGTDNNFGEIDISPMCCGGLSTPFIFENEAGVYELLIGSQEGGIFHYGNIEGNLEGAFVTKSDSFGLIAEGVKTSPFGADINGDGEIEWVVGNGRGGIAIYQDSSLLNTNIATGLPGKSLRLYPNPGKHPTLTLSAPGPTAIKIRVFDLMGRLVSHTEKEINTSSRQLDLQHENPGIYLIEIMVAGASPQYIKWDYR